MLRIHCPYCGPRNSQEFRHTGEAGNRPDAATTGPEKWRAYLYVRDNPVGWTTETWFHRAGCRRYLVAERHTLTNEIRAVRPAGPAQSAPPAEDLPR
jgi:sarcosine oxidase, subunit delta